MIGLGLVEAIPAEDILAKADPDDADGDTGFGDIDGDGDLDLYVANAGQANVLYRNQGDGTFEDVTASAGNMGRSS